MKIIVSLTSFPAAIKYAENAIKSILRGAILPDKIILYLTAEQFPNREFPALGIDDGRFEIRWCEENIRSYTKLVPALRDFPDDIIITIDDDLIYNSRLLEKLIETHKKYPDAIIGHRVRRIKIGKPYRKWKRYSGFRYIFRSLRPSFRNLQTGVGGVLYPPRSLDAEMLDSQLFMKMAPTVDDVWFWAAAVAKGTKIAPVPWGCVKLHEVGKPEEITLSSVNIRTRKDVNREAVEAVLLKFPVIKQRLEEVLKRSVVL